MTDRDTPTGDHAGGREGRTAGGSDAPTAEDATPTGGGTRTADDATPAGDGTDRGGGDVATDGEFPGISNPVTGVTIVPVVGPEETDGEYAEASVRLAPGADGPPEHVHPDTEERFAVEAGQVRMSVDGRERVLSPGTEVRVSPGTPHTFANAGDEPARMRTRAIPPGDLGEVLATLFGLAHDGRTDAGGRPEPLQAAVMAERTLDETYFTGVPRAVQRALGATLGPVGRALGYRATYDRYLDAEFWRARVDADAASDTDTTSGTGGDADATSGPGDADTSPGTGDDTTPATDADAGPDGPRGRPGAADRPDAGED